MSAEGPMPAGLAAGAGDGGDDELPLLTDVVVTDTFAPPPIPDTARREPTLRPRPDPAEIARLAEEIVARRLTALRADIDREIAVWLAVTLPEVVRSELAGLGDRLMVGLRAQVLATLLPELQRAVDETQPPQDAG